LAAHCLHEVTNQRPSRAHLAPPGGLGAPGRLDGPPLVELDGFDRGRERVRPARRANRQLAGCPRPWGEKVCAARIARAAQRSFAWRGRRRVARPLARAVPRARPAALSNTTPAGPQSDAAFQSYSAASLGPFRVAPCGQFAPLRSASHRAPLGRQSIGARPAVRELAGQPIATGSPFFSLARPLGHLSPAAGRSRGAQPHRSRRAAARQSTSQAPGRPSVSGPRGQPVALARDGALAGVLWLVGRPSAPPPPAASKPAGQRVSKPAREQAGQPTAVPCI